MRLGLVGCGYFGRIILKAMASDLGIVPDIVADPLVCMGDVSESASGSEILDSVTVVHEIETHLRDLDAVIIATPPADHIDLIIKAVNADTHVFCEKPLVVPDPTKATHSIGLLIHDAHARRLIVHVDHTLCYCPKRLDKVSLATRRVEAIRENPEVNKHGLSVVWDLLVHEVAVAVLLRGLPEEVYVTPQDPTRDRVEVKLAYGSLAWDIKCENGSSRRRELFVDGDRVESTGEPLVEDVAPVTRSIGEFLRCIGQHGSPVPSPTGLSHALYVAAVLENVERQTAKQREAVS